MTTAEYAVGTVAAVAFAVVLYKIVRSPAVSSTLASVIQSALHAL
jgi:predicted small secreted protein